MSVYKRPGSQNYWYKFVFEGHRIQESAGTTDRQAAEQAEAHHKRTLWERSRLGVKPSRVWEDAATSYLNTLPDGRNKIQTAAELARYNDQLIGRELSKIDLDLLEKLQQARADDIRLRTGRQARPGTVNRCLGIVMSVLHHAASKKWLDHVPHLAKLPDTERVIRFISRPEAERLIAELPPHQQRMVIFALETGLRMSNVTQLRWAQVDLKRRLAWVNPPDAKEKKGIAVPLSDTVVKLLGVVVGEHPEYVFVYRDQPVTKTSTKAWKLAKQRAGITNFRWHDLRHTWASWHRQDGTPVAVLKELGAWTDDRMPGRYAHLGDDHLAEFVNRRRGLDTEMATAVKRTAVKEVVK